MTALTKQLEARYFNDDEVAGASIAGPSLLVRSSMMCWTS